MGITATAYPEVGRQLFGVHSICSVSRSTRIPTGIARIMGDVSLAFEASSVRNMGGSSWYPWGTEITEINPTLGFQVKEYPNWIMENYAAAKVTTTAASATDGTVSALTNKEGTSVSNATTGIATATLKSGQAANLKTGTYRVIAASATTVDVYAVSNFQFTRGTDLYAEDNTMKITESALTIVDAGASPAEIPGTGVELTGGSGTVNFVAGDVAEFTVTPPHNGISKVEIGVNGYIFPEHELYIFGKQRADGKAMYVHCPKAVCTSGMTWNFSQGDFSSTDITVDLLNDATLGNVATLYFSDQIL
jgi:hypothetical protein